MTKAYILSILMAIILMSCKESTSKIVDNYIYIQEDTVKVKNWKLILSIKKFDKNSQILNFIFYHFFF